MLAIQSAFGGETSPKGPYGLEAMSADGWLLVTGVFLAPATIGVAEVLCGLKVLYGSRQAAVVAIVLVSVQAMAAIVIGSLYYAAGRLTLFPSARNKWDGGIRRNAGIGILVAVSSGKDTPSL